MIWQLLLMWVLVVATLVWFIRDERRRKAEAAQAKARQFNSTRPRGPIFGPGSVPVPLDARRTGGLTAKQRRDLMKLQQRQVHR